MKRLQVILFHLQTITYSSDDKTFLKTLHRKSNFNVENYFYLQLKFVLKVSIIKLWTQTKLY